MSAKNLLAAGCLILGLGSQAHAVVTPVFDNMAQASDPALNADPITIDGPIGASFTTSSTTTSLGAISLLLTDDAGSSGSFIVFIAPDLGGIPDFVLANAIWQTPSAILDSTVAPDANGYWDLSFAGTNGVSVAPNTTYWMVVTDAGSGSDVSWLFANTSDGIGGIYEETWFSGGASNQNQEGPYVMSVTVNDAPEPASLAILGAGLSGMGLLRWRQRRRV